MYGFGAEVDEPLGIAARLQDHIEGIYGPGSDCPMVSASFAQFAAAIEVDNETVWCSEDGEELTYEVVLERFTEQCRKWAMFV